MSGLRRWTAVALCLVAAAAVRADDEDIKALNEQYAKAEEAWYENARKTNDYDRKTHPAVAFQARFKTYAVKHSGEPSALPALQWIVENGGSSSNDAEEVRTLLRWTLAELREHHAGGSGVKDILPRLQYLGYQVGNEPLIAFFDKVVETNEDPEIKAAATFNKAYTLLHPDDRGADHARAKSGVKQARELFAAVAKDFAETAIASRAKGFVFELDHLQIGMKAPEIVGTDVDGKEIRLSQFRGQVVVLDFWGFW